MLRCNTNNGNLKMNLIKIKWNHGLMKYSAKIKRHRLVSQEYYGHERVRNFQELFETHRLFFISL